MTGAPVPEVTAVHGDRRDPGSLRLLADRTWDLVVDTWAGAPSAVKASTQALSDHAGVYACELPIYLPPDHEYAGMHDSNVERAHAAGLRCRPLIDSLGRTNSRASTARLASGTA